MAEVSAYGPGKAAEERVGREAETGNDVADGDGVRGDGAVGEGGGAWWAVRECAGGDRDGGKWSRKKK